MAGTINSLGLGSGVLTSSVLDQLKAADTAQLVTPIDNKITLNQQKSQALDLLSSLLTTFKSSASALDDDTLYQKRTVTGGNDGVSVTALAGTQIQDFSLNITNIAKKSVVESAAYTSATASVANGSGTLNLGIGKNNYSINYTSTSTLTDLKQAINDTAGSDVTASILQTGTSAYNLVVTSKTTGQAQTISMTDTSGQLKDANLVTPHTQSGSFLAKDDFIAATGTTGTLTLNVGGTTANFAYTDTTTLQGLADSINADTTLSPKVSANIVQYGTNDYRMVLTPKSTDINSAITISDSVGGGLSPAMTGVTNTLGSMGIIQDAKDAHFTFDGISMTRSTNTISDVTYGTTINLLKDAGSANISITQNREQIATEMGTMVSSYNTLMKQLDDMTAYDAVGGKVGIFNGDNTIKDISRQITKIITSVDSKGYSLPQYGISLDKTGVMSFDKAVFTTKMDADPTGTEGFFSGKTTVLSVGTTKTSAFLDPTSLISSGASGTMALNITGVGYNFNYTNTTTLQQMTDSINADATLNTKLSASVVKYATGDYRMVLTPKGQTVGEAISIKDSTGGGLIGAMTTTTSSSDVVSTTDGVFTSLNNLFNTYTSSKGLINNLTESAKTATTSLNDQKTKATAMLTARYDTMTAKFAAYDSMISKLTNAFAPLLQTINAANKATN
ncbi:MAG: flagellar filament capping protein FliD [Campylobacterales bacterium]|nr:flagellar filament capping protein FliD [Campylobacterales bacterium]